MGMTVRLGALPVAAALLLVLLLTAARAQAASYLGSPDASIAPDAFACAACKPGSVVGFRQFALRRATTEAPEGGVLVSATVNAKRIAGVEDPRIAVLRPVDDSGVGVTVADSAPLPVTSPSGGLSKVDGLHLDVRGGDSIGFLFGSGEVDVGVKGRPRPDGAIETFTQPCGPCGTDAGAGVELLFNAVVEPDVDADGLGDESQDPDGGGLGLDWEDDWFEDYDAGDELDPDFGEDVARHATRRPLGLLDVERLRGGRATLLLRVPKAGRVSASVTLPANSRTGAGPFLTILTGDMRATRPGRVRLRLEATPAGARVLERRKHVRTKVVVAFFASKRAAPGLLMRSARL
jgi:hypothetical protein